MSDNKFNVGDKVVFMSDDGRALNTGVVQIVNGIMTTVDFGDHCMTVLSSELQKKEKEQPKVSDFVDAVCNIFDELKETFRKKNEQYATTDPLANFRTGALLNEGIDTWGAMYEEAKNYQRKHIAHVQNNKINGPKVGESLTDIAVYAVLMKYMHDRHYDKAIADWQKEEGKTNE